MDPDIVPTVVVNLNLDTVENHGAGRSINSEKV